MKGKRWDVGDGKVDHVSGIDGGMDSKVLLNARVRGYTGRAWSMAAVVDVVFLCVDV